jgi:hypothetical protein
VHFWLLKRCALPSQITSQLPATGFWPVGPPQLCGLVGRDAALVEAVIALSIADRERILRLLDDPSAGLPELRGVLLREHEWRVRERLV